MSIQDVIAEIEQRGHYVVDDGILGCVVGPSYGSGACLSHDQLPQYLAQLREQQADPVFHVVQGLIR